MMLRETRRRSLCWRPVGSVIFEAKDGAYEPVQECDILK